VNRLLIVAGCHGSPLSRVNTWPVSVQAGPHWSRSAACCAFHVLSAATVSGKRGIGRLPAWTDTGHVFTRESGEPWHPATISKRFTKAVEAVDVPRMRLHDLRHGFATYHLAAGTQAKHLQKLMGHARIGVTMDVYVHPEYEDLAAAQDNLAAVMGKGKA
jgi:integrase